MVVGRLKSVISKLVISKRNGSRLVLIALSLLIVLGLLAACGDVGAIPGTPVPLGSAINRTAGQDTMNAVEAYMQAYQPGPEPRLFQTTNIYDRNGVLIAELMDEGRRTWVPLDQVSPHLIQATIATEDASFYTNSGIDTKRIIGAVLRNIQSGTVVSGASTITMQLARNLFMGPEQRYDQTVDRKLLEAGIAQELTDLYSKDEILEMYLNLLNYGQLAYGPEAAANVYFGKSAADLTLAEASLLAGLPQQPAYLNPYLDYEAAKGRQRIVLDLMVRHGYLSPVAADAAHDEPIFLIGEPGLATNLAPHFVQYVIQALDDWYGEGYTRRSGLNITTTLDLGLQGLAQDAVSSNVAKLQPVYGLSNASLVAMLPNSSEIVAMVGSADFDDPAIAGQVNVALQPRQPGSAIKPLLYATAIEQNVISPATVIWDTPVEYESAGQPIYAPGNYDETFHGPVTVRSALANSYNVPAVKLLAGVGVDGLLAGAENLGINSLDLGTDWYGLSLALGGGEVPLLELATAFNTLASDGNYLPPDPVLSLVDNMDNTLPVESPEPRVAVSPETAFLISDMLSDNEARTPAFGPNNPLQLEKPAAVKTGTTTDFRDNWTVGYTRYLAAGVWAGNSDGTPMRNASGVTGAAPIWRDFMTGVLADPQMLATISAPDATNPPDDNSWKFVPPEGVVLLDRCPPSVTCRRDGEYYRALWLNVDDAASQTASPVESVVMAPSAPVYVQRDDAARLAGFCTIDGGAMDRPLLTLEPLMMPEPVLDNVAGIVDAEDSSRQGGIVTAVRNLFIAARANDQPSDEPAAGDVDASSEAAIADSFVDTLDEEALEPEAWSDEKLAALAWTLQHGAAVSLGPCDELQGRINESLERWPVGSLNGQRVLVDMGAAYNADVGEPGQMVAMSSLSGAVDIASIVGPPGEGTEFYAVTQPVLHDAACPGRYIMGRVQNAAGGPVAGVTVVSRDEWGNSAHAVSKSGQMDFGQFDLPVNSDTPHTIYVTVVDGAGTSISPTVPVLHGQGEAGTAPCHHIVFQGGV